MSWSTEIYRDIPFQELERIRIHATRSIQKNPTLRSLIIAEPQPTFTAGRTAKPDDLIWNETLRRERGVETVRLGRGGQWTYHGPGQIVLYPIASLKELSGSSRRVSWYLNTLRRAVTEFLIALSIPATPGDSPFGIYVGAAKIASFGVSVERGVVSHGVALYGSDQSAYFAGIHGCGAPNTATTSIDQRAGRFSWAASVSQLIPCIEMAFHSEKTCYPSALFDTKKRETPCGSSHHLFQPLS